MVQELAIDLGSSNIRVHLKGRGIILNEPSVVAVDSHTQEVVAVGKQAYEMLGRTPQSITVIRPIRRGVIHNIELAEALLLILLDKINMRQWFSKANILICAPSLSSDVERLSLVEIVEKVSHARVHLEDEIRVAAIGSGIKYDSPNGSMVVDIGGGITDIAVVSSGEIIAKDSLKWAGEDFDQLLVQYFQSKYQLLVGERSIEQLKKALATAKKLDEAEQLVQEVRGRDLVSGLPKSMNVHSNHLYEGLEGAFERIARSMKRILEDVAPEIASDIIERGIILTGGSANIYHLDTYLTDYLSVSVIRADQPLDSVAIGGGLMLDLILTGKFQRTNPTLKQRIMRFLARLKRRIMG